MLSPLDLLYARRQILAGDYLAGQRFGFLAKRRSDPRHAPAFEAAVEALAKSGARTIVEAVVLDGQLPRGEKGLSRLLNGLDALNTHFKKFGPPVLQRISPGCRPSWWFKAIAA